MGTFAVAVIVDYLLLLPTKENECPFSISICSKQTEVCHFSLAENLWKLPFSFSEIPKAWRHWH
jgi:hypothetical protein